MDKLLPHDLESEAYLLENSFCPGGIEKAAEIVSPQDFYSEGGQLIFAKMMKFHQSGRGFTLSMVDDTFRDDPAYEGISRILDTLRPVTAEAVTHFAKIVKELSDRRQVIKATSEACEKLHDISTPLNEVVNFLNVEVCRLATVGVDYE